MEKLTRNRSRHAELCVSIVPFHGQEYRLTSLRFEKEKQKEICEPSWTGNEIDWEKIASRADEILQKCIKTLVAHVSSFVCDKIDNQQVFFAGRFQLDTHLTCVSSDWEEQLYYMIKNWPRRHISTDNDYRITTNRATHDSQILFSSVSISSIGNQWPDRRQKGGRKNMKYYEIMTYLATLRPRKNRAISWSDDCQGRPRARTTVLLSTSSSFELV